mmetsp:Transcript_96/g.171  ORF Transcript_96/g.171 Transcript_96/m.171 type:complete len:122 (-) Transcript_96:131-496(-)
MAKTRLSTSRMKKVASALRRIFDGEEESSNAKLGTLANTMPNTAARKSCNASSQRNFIFQCQCWQSNSFNHARSGSPNFKPLPSSLVSQNVGKARCSITVFVNHPVASLAISMDAVKETKK